MKKIKLNSEYQIDPSLNFQLYDPKVGKEITEKGSEIIKELSEREEFLKLLDEHGLTEEEFGQSCNDYFDTMKSAM